MSAMPPPPPFGTAQPYNRQAQRAQQRAQAAQVRWQRDQLRLQARASRRRSIVGPVLLVVLGVILLLLESGRLRWSDALIWLGRWWPAVLIGAGLLMIAEWTMDRRQMTAAGTPVIPRRTLGGGATWILVLLALVGATVMAAENSSDWVRRTFGSDFGSDFAGNGLHDWPRAFGIGSEFTQDLTEPLAPAGTLTIDDPRGDISVTGSSQDGQVHVTVRQHIYTWQRDDVDRLRRAEAPHLTGDRNHLTLTASSQGEDKTDLVIELPHDAVLAIRSGHGDLNLEELRGALDIAADNGDIKLTALSGPVHLKTQDDDATITAHSLAAGLVVDGRSGDISLSDVQGAVTLHGDFFGTTHLERIRGAVNFQSSFTNFACASIPGELNIEGRSDLDGHGLDGPVTLSTTDRNLTLEGVRGAATIHDKNGSVNLTLAGPLQPVQVVNTNGSVEVGVPTNQGFAIDAHTENGEIMNEFGAAPQKSGDSSQLSANVGAGGNKLNVQTTEGDITLRRASATDPTDWNQSADRITPTPAAAGDKPATHHHTAR